MVQNHTHSPSVPDFHVIVFSDTLFETNGIGSYYRTLLEWSRHHGNGRVIVVCPAREPTRSDRGLRMADWEKRTPVQGTTTADDPQSSIPVSRFPGGSPDVIPIRPRARFRNPVYPDLMLGYYPQAPLQKVLESIPGPKLIHIATPGPLGMAGAKLARRMKLASVGCYHVDLQKYAKLYGRSILGGVGQWFGFKVGRLCDIRAYGSCSAMCAPSETAAEMSRTFFTRDIAVIPNPIDVSHFRPSPTRQGAFRKKYNSDGKVLAVVVGRIAHEKNLDLVCEHLVRDPRINTVFVGDGPYCATLRRRWNATVTGFLQGDDLLAAYQQADVFVQLSVTETFGLCLAEAMASGLPAVVLRAQGLMDRIPPGNGVDLIEEAGLPELADKCVALVTDRGRHQEYALRARAYAEQISVDAVLPQFMEFHRNFAR